MHCGSFLQSKFCAPLTHYCTIINVLTLFPDVSVIYANCIDYLPVSKWTLSFFCALALYQVFLDFITVRGRRWCVLSHLRRWKYDKPKGRGCSQIEFICNNLFPSQQQMPGNHVRAISGEQLSLSNEKSQQRL